MEYLLPLFGLLYFQPLYLTHPDHPHHLPNQPVSIRIYPEHGHKVLFLFVFISLLYSVSWALSGSICFLSAWEICRLNKWPESLKWRKWERHLDFSLLMPAGEGSSGKTWTYNSHIYFLIFKFLKLEFLLFGILRFGFLILEFLLFGFVKFGILIFGFLYLDFSCL